jgi:hypothetical protein
VRYFVSGVAFFSGRKDQRSSFHLMADDCVTACAWGYVTATVSQGWNGAWAIEFLSLLYNPLRSTGSQMAWYHAVIWPLTAILTGYLLAVKANEHADPNTCAFAFAGGHFDFALEFPIYSSTALAFVSLVYALLRLLVRGTANTRAARCRLFARHLIFMVVRAWWGGGGRLRER